MRAFVPLWCAPPEDKTTDAALDKGLDADPEAEGVMVREEGDSVGCDTEEGAIVEEVKGSVYDGDEVGADVDAEVAAEVAADVAAADDVGSWWLASGLETGADGDKPRAEMATVSPDARSTTTVLGSTELVRVVIGLPEGSTTWIISMV